MSEDPNVIPVFQPHIGDDTLDAVREAFDIGWLGMGATTAAFERGIAEYIGVGERHVIATNTGTSALHIAVALADIGPGDEVIVPSFNFVADHQAISAEGASPVFCDIRERRPGHRLRRRRSSDLAPHEGDHAAALRRCAVRHRPRVRPREANTACA